MQSYLWDMNYDWAEEKGTAWYRSKEPVIRETTGGGCGYLSNNKWPLIEIFSQHLIRLQQVSLNKIHRVLFFFNLTLKLPKC